MRRAPTRVDRSSATLARRCPRSTGTRRLVAALLADLFMASVLASQSAGSVAALPGSTRAAGLGGAGAALVGDAGAIFANPAALATVRHMVFEGFYERYLFGTTLYGAALAARLPRLDWGVGAQALSPSPGTTPGSSDFLAASALVFRTGLIALGTSAKYARQTIGGAPAHAWAGDAGVAIAVFDLLAFGASVQNIGGNFGGGVHLPRRTRAGFTMNYVDPEGTFRLLTTLEGQWPDLGSAFLVLGVEGGVVTHGLGVIARAGYAGHSVSTAASPFTVGGSITLRALDLDYAYHSFDAPNGGRHRFGLRWTP